MLNASPLPVLDPEIYSAIAAELARQQGHIELIASENFTYPAVLEAQGSVLTNKYAEGYPGKRWYGGCEQVDKVEQLAIDRAKTIFGADHANVQPHSGAQANTAVYASVLVPGDKVLGMNLSHGGHLTHGNPANFSGKLYNFCQYGVRENTGRLDYDELAATAAREKPKMITVGASAYSRTIDFARMGEIARSVGALLFADIAHIAGLVAAGLHPSPVAHADFVTTTTHTKPCAARAAGSSSAGPPMPRRLTLRCSPARRAARSCTSLPPRPCASPSASSPNSRPIPPRSSKTRRPSAPR